MFHVFVVTSVDVQVAPCYVGLGSEMLMFGWGGQDPGWINKTIAYVLRDDNDGWAPIFRTSDGQDVLIDHSTRRAWVVDLDTCKTRVSYPPLHADALSVVA